MGFECQVVIHSEVIKVMQEPGGPGKCRCVLQAQCADRPQTDKGAEVSLGAEDG